MSKNHLYQDAAKDYLRFSRLPNPNLVGILTEQSALCYLKTGHVRQFGFQSILAGHQFNVAGKKLHSLRFRVYKRNILMKNESKIFLRNFILISRKISSMKRLIQSGLN